MDKLGFDTVSLALGKAENYPRWIVDRFRPFIGPEVLEIGLGHANFRPIFGKLETYVGVDIDERVVESARKLYPDDRFITCDMCAPDFVDRVNELTGGKHFDTVLSFNTLQYVADERVGISNMLKLLRLGGYLCLQIPASKLLFGEMDRHSGHRYRYERSHVAEMVPEELGEIMFNKFFNFVGAAGWCINNMKKHDSLEDEGLSFQFTLFDKYLVPLSRLIDPMMQHIFGLSLVVGIQRR